MVAVRGSLSESYPAVEATVAEARHAVAQFARTVGGVSGEALDAVRLAVSEAVTNAIVHAYVAPGGVVYVDATVIEDELWVLVADDGQGHQSPTRNPGLGLGLGLIADSSEHFVILERAEGGTEARMRFAAGPRSVAQGA